MEPDDEARREAAVGAALRAARGRESQRAVAKRAGVSPTQWRHMERGSREHDVPVRASDKVLEAAANAVGLEPSDVFALAGRTYEGPIRRALNRPSEAELDQRLSAVESDLAVIREAVEELLDREPRGAAP